MIECLGNRPLILRVDLAWRGLITIVIFLLTWLLLSQASLSEELLPQPAVLPSRAGGYPAEMPSNSQTSPRLSSSDISLEKVNQFVQAYLQVLQLIELHEDELQGAETEPEAQQIERQIEIDALAVIKSAGLTRQEYLQLLSLASADPEFGERIAAQLQELS